MKQVYWTKLLIKEALGAGSDFPPKNREASEYCSCLLPPTHPQVASINILPMNVRVQNIILHAIFCYITLKIGELLFVIIV